MNLEKMTIEQLKALAYDISIEIQKMQYNMQLIVSEINKKNSSNKACEVFKNIKESKLVQKPSKVENKSGVTK